MALLSPVRPPLLRAFVCTWRTRWITSGTRNKQRKTPGLESATCPAVKKGHEAAKVLLQALVVEQVSSNAERVDVG